MSRPAAQIRPPALCLGPLLNVEAHCIMSSPVRAFSCAILPSPCRRASELPFFAEQRHKQVKALVCGTTRITAGYSLCEAILFQRTYLRALDQVPWPLVLRCCVCAHLCTAVTSVTLPPRTRTDAERSDIEHGQPPAGRLAQNLTRMCLPGQSVSRWPGARGGKAWRAGQDHVVAQRGALAKSAWKQRRL